MKVCKTCHEEKPFEFFGLHKRPNDKVYYRADCKECCKEKLKAYKKTPAGMENHKARMRKYMADQKLLADAALKAIEAGILKDPRC